MSPSFQPFHAIAVAQCCLSAYILLSGQLGLLEAPHCLILLSQLKLRITWKDETLQQTFGFQCIADLVLLFMG